MSPVEIVARALYGSNWHLNLVPATKVLEALDTAGLLPKGEEWRRGHIGQYMSAIFEEPPTLNHGDFLLRRRVTEWEAVTS